MADQDTPQTSDSEMKPLTIRVPTTLRERFVTLAQNEGLNQTDMFERILGSYQAGGSQKAQAAPEPEPEKFDRERAELSHATATIREAAESLEALARKIKESEGAEGYKRSLREIAEEASAINTLLGGVKRLHEIIGSSHKLILEASEKASEPFQKIVLDQAGQAQKFADLYQQIATHTQALEKVASSSVQKAEKLANTLDHQVTTAATESAQKIYQKTHEYLSLRNTFLNVIMIGTLVALLGSMGAIYYAKKQGDAVVEMAQNYVHFYHNFRAATCDLRKGKKAAIESLMSDVECR
jgi:hypothetical protein